jgi:glutamate synthase domain-containing protein 3
MADRVLLVRREPTTPSSRSIPDQQDNCQEINSLISKFTANLRSDAAHALSQWQSLNRKLDELIANGATESEIHAQESLCKSAAAHANRQFSVYRERERAALALEAWKQQYRANR